jgi:hypothetical protein
MNKDTAGAETVSPTGARSRNGGFGYQTYEIVEVAVNRKNVAFGVAVPTRYHLPS